MKRRVDKSALHHIQCRRNRKSKTKIKALQKGGILMFLSYLPQLHFFTFSVFQLLGSVT